MILGLRFIFEEGRGHEGLNILKRIFANLPANTVVKTLFLACFSFSLLIFAFAIPPSPASSNDKIPICAYNLSDFLCFKQNLHILYEADNKLFWQIWVHHENDAKSCSSLSITSPFISLVEECDGVLAEAMHEFIENMIFDDVLCLLDSTEKLDDDILQYLIRFYFMAPLYHEPSEILPTIEKQLKKKRYPNLYRIYFRIMN